MLPADPQLGATPQPVVKHSLSPLKIWFILICATLLTWQIGEQGASGLGITLFIFALAIYKGSLVANHFMRLNTAPRLWQGVVLGWLLLTSSLILVAYALGGA